MTDMELVNKGRPSKIDEPAEPSRKRAGRLQPEQRRKQLLICAVQEFSRTGIGSTVHADIARRAGVSVPTVFQYFATREILTFEVIAEVEQFLLKILDETIGKAGSSTDTIRSVLLGFADAVDTYPDYIKIWMNWSTILDGPTWPSYIEFQDRVLAKFETLIEQSKAAGEVHDEIDATMGAHLIMGSGHMIAQMKFRHRDDAMVERFIQSLIERALFTG